MAAIAVSVAVTGSAYSVSPAEVAGVGSAVRSSLPFGVSGRASRKTNCDGSMYSGSMSRTAARIAAGCAASSGRPVR